MPDRRALRAVLYFMAAAFVFSRTGPWGTGEWVSWLLWHGAIVGVIVLVIVGAARRVRRADSIALWLVLGRRR